MPELSTPAAADSAAHRKLSAAGDGRPPLERVIAEQALAPAARADEIGPYLRWMHDTYGRELLGVLFYGSCLSPATRKADSTPDFFVITRDGNIPRHGWWTRALHQVVPPSSQSGAITTADGEHFFKYIHIDLPQLRAATGPAMRDLFVAGRLSKRVKLVYWRDEESRDAIVQSLVGAVRSLAPLVCCQLTGEVDAARYLSASLEISYLGEWRIEAAGKVASLLAAAPEYYRTVYRGVLDEQLRAGRLRRVAADRYLACVQQRERAATARLLRQSRIRGACRWPQYGLTVRHGLLIMIAKIQRTHPEVHLSPVARRHPVLFALPTFFRLLRAGVIKTHPTS